MLSVKKFVFSFIASASFSIMMPAQELPGLGQASEIKKGTLDCGVQYYLVTNNSYKGRADVAVIQPHAGIVDVARLSLSSLSHSSGTRSPYRFFSSKGISFREGGYISYPGPERFHATTMDSKAYGKKRNPTLFLFENVPVTDVAMDTTLLLSFDIVNTNPYAQAIVVSGDIASDKILTKMKLFSMMVAKRTKVPSFPAYAWKPSDTVRVVQRPSPGGDLVRVTATYASPRTPKAALGTIQPLVSEMFAQELGSIVSSRVAHVMSEMSAPLGDFSFDYGDSGASWGDETYSFSILTDPASAQSAVQALSRVLSEMDVHGATLKEYAYAKGVLKLSSHDPGGRTLNREYVDKCISSYLYGTSLASPSAFRDFLSKREVASEQELALFNKFVSALLDPRRCLTLTLEGADLTDPAGTYVQTWKRHSSLEAPTYPSRDENIPYPLAKDKLKKTEPEPVTGGEIWTFASGIRVAYKQVPGQQDFAYALQIRGGSASVKELLPQESGFLSDMLWLYRIGGSSGSDFRKMLTRNGITMDAEVSLSDLRISGSAPVNQFSLVMRALLCVANERKMDLQAYEKYRRSEALRLQLMGAEGKGYSKAALWEMAAPGCANPAFKSVSGLTDDLPYRADKYYQAQFANVNDGIIVLTGGLDTEQVKKIMARITGAFRTGRRSSVRPVVEFPLRAGSTARKVSGMKGMDMQLTALLPLTSDNYMAAAIAHMILRDCLVAPLAGCGMSLETDWKFASLPKEHITVWLRSRPSDPDSMPYFGTGSDPSQAVQAVNKALDSVAAKAPSAAEVNACKDRLQSILQKGDSDPQAICGRILMRYADGKNLFSNYKDAIKKVSPANVQAVLKTLCTEGARVAVEGD